MKITNTIENLIIITLISGIMIYANIQTTKSTVKSLEPVLIEGMRKETNAIRNEFKTEIRKLKTSKKSEATIILTPQYESGMEVKTDTIQAKSEPKNKKKEKGFLSFNWLFSKMD